MLPEERCICEAAKFTPGEVGRPKAFTLNLPMNVLFGINTVTEALKARGRAFEWVGVAKERHDLRLQKLIQECRQQGIPVRLLPRVELDRMAATASHQGVVAVTSSKQYADLDDVIAAKRGEYALVIVLDGVEDPHNLGAILRTADAAGADACGRGTTGVETTGAGAAATGTGDDAVAAGATGRGAAAGFFSTAGLRAGP